METKPNLDFLPEKSFDSLKDCIRFICNNYPENKLIEVSSIEIETGESLESLFPAHLYRGEAISYPTSTSSLYRVKTDPSLSIEFKEKINNICKKINLELQKFAGISPIHSEAFIQHYGLPTTLLDVTSSLDIAAHFASDSKIGETGLICVLSYENMDRDTNIIDLRNHHYALRPRWQQALAFSHNYFLDLKSTTCIKRLKLKWFSFILNETDINQYKVKDEILDAHKDKFAGQIQLIVDSFEKQEDKIAKWLSENITPAPFVAKTIDYYDIECKQPKTIELRSMEDAGMLYDKALERENNYKKWSKLFPEIKPNNLPKPKDIL